MTTIVAIRRNNETLIATDGVLNSGDHHVAFGINKAYKLGNFLIAEAGSASLAFESRRIIETMFSGDQFPNFLKKDFISMNEQNYILQDLKSKIEFIGHAAAILIWGAKHGYVLNADGLTVENRLLKNAYANEINDNYYIFGSGQQAASATYLTLLKHKSKISNDKLATECVEMAGNLRMSTHSQTFFIKL